LIKIFKMINKMNKKAVGKEILYFIATVFIIILLVAFFFMSKFFSPKAPDIASEFTAKQQNLVSFMAVLNTKVMVDGQNITMADLFRLAQANETYKKVLIDNEQEVITSTRQIQIWEFSYSELKGNKFYSISNFAIPGYPTFNLWFGIRGKI